MLDSLHLPNSHSPSSVRQEGGTGGHRGLQLALTATWRSEPLVEAQRSGFPELAPVQAGALEFFVTMHTREWAWNHLERPDGTFRVWLLVDGVRSEALRVVRHADRKGFEFVYPDVTNLRVAYDVVFPATALKSTSRSVQLLVGGPPGRVALEWRLAGTVGANGGAPRTHSIMEARRAAGSAN